MPSKPPFFRQARYDTCALACLRMILAHYGIETTEEALVQAAHMEEGGVDIEELAQLASAFGLQATIRRLSLPDLSGLIARGQFSIVYLNRLPIDGEFAVHAVIPIRVSRRFVAFLDPRRGQRRVSTSQFEASQRYLDHFGIVCTLPGTAEDWAGQNPP